MKEELTRLIEQLILVRHELENPGSTELPHYLAASDLHGNAWRLKEILATAEREEIDCLYLVGDIYSGNHGWSVYRTLRPLIDSTQPPRVVPLWGNHELAFVAGMLGNDSQLRFFFGFGGRELIAEMNAELAADGQPMLSAADHESPSPDDLAEIRGCQRLQEMMWWIQKTHQMVATDMYGTGYLHASPRITRGGRVEVQYQTERGMQALQQMQRDLAEVASAKHPVFSALLQTDISPLWGMFEITSAKQFDLAYNPLGIRQLVFGHRHRSDAVNVAGVNRQICIAVDFDEGLGGYLRVGPDGLLFRRFVDSDSQRTTETQLIISPDSQGARRTHLLEVEEFLVRRLIDAEKAYFSGLSPASNNNRREFEKLEALRQQQFSWIPRLYAEVYPLVKDLSVRKEMFSIVVESCDEEAFKSLIHLLHYKTRELKAHGGDWYNEAYVESKAFVQVLLEALRQMPVRRLGLLNAHLRGTTSRVNLLELYQRVLELQDPDLAVMAVDNLGALEYWGADQELRTAFFHDARKVRVHAAQALASRGEVAYPLVKTLMQTADNWVRFLAVWTIGKLGENNSAIAQQALGDLRQLLGRENDWLIYTSGKELLRKLGDPHVDDLTDRLEIPELTADVIDTLQSIVDAQQEPFRKAFRVYYITVVISSLVYRRGLRGLDLDELKIYVNNADYFPSHYRFYKSATRDKRGHWQGWRRLWIRGETFNRPDGPEIIKLPKEQVGELPAAGPQTVVLYDHRSSAGRVALPELQEVIERFGQGKAKDRVRDSLMQNWMALDESQRAIICRIHAAAAIKMLFDLPSEIFVSPEELETLNQLSDPNLECLAPLPKPLLTLDPPLDRLTEDKNSVVRANWLDAIKYSVPVCSLDSRSSRQAASSSRS